jgi:hypothetical protein
MITRENDQEFSEATEAMWRESLEARKSATVIEIESHFSPEAQKASLIAEAREQAMWEMHSLVVATCIARVDRVIAELRS